VADGWCWFVLREKYCWLVAGGWFVLREKYCWLVTDKPSEQGVRVLWWNGRDRSEHYSSFLSHLSSISTPILPPYHKSAILTFEKNLTNSATLEKKIYLISCLIKQSNLICIPKLTAFG
jgi:hypothetical protein